MFSKCCVAFCFAITTSVAATAGKFKDNLPVKTTTKYTNSDKVWKVIPPKVDKVSNSIDVIVKGNKAICWPDLAFKWPSVLP